VLELCCCYSEELC